MKNPLGYTIFTLSLILVLTSCNKVSTDDASPNGDAPAIEEELTAELEAEEAERVAREKERKTRMNAIMSKFRKSDSIALKDIKATKSKETAKTEDLVRA